MRAVLVLLVLGDLLLAFALSRAERARESLRDEKAALEQRLSGVESARGERRAVADLLDAYARVESRREVPELGIAGLRETLLRSERGLDLERLSLEFRPETDLPAGYAGSRIEASLRGSFEAVYGYLSRLEALHLPLAPEELTLRSEGKEGGLALSARWTAAWPREPAALAPPSAADAALLLRWLHDGEDVWPVRDPFRAARAPGEGLSPFPMKALPEPAPPPESTAAAAATAEPERPRLTGFVIARPELEPDVRRRVLAALRFEGKLQLVGVGDAVGLYRVEAIDSRESVALRDEATGERLLLRLE